jgi:lipoyl-dependent peroxiredoxin subunit D
MRLSDLAASLPDYARDLRRNLDRVLLEAGSPGLTARQIHAVALAAAISARHLPLIRAIEALAADTLQPGELDGVRGAAARMAMTAIYHRAIHLLGDPAYATLRSGLRVDLTARTGIDPLAFELAALAAAAIHGCAACLDAHEQALRRYGLDRIGVQSALRIAAVIHAVAVTLEQRGRSADPG